MRRLMFELRVIEEGPTPVLCDNQSSIRLVNNHVLHEKTKHVEIYYQFVREKSPEGVINVSYIPTSIQQANIFTKWLTAYRHACMREEARLLQLPTTLKPEGAKRSRANVVRANKDPRNPQLQQACGNSCARLLENHQPQLYNHAS